MPRQKSFLQSITQTRREAERQRVARARAESQLARAAVQAKKAYESSLVAEQKERARLYTESRIAQVALQNEQLEQIINQLSNLLNEALLVSSVIRFETLKQNPQIPPFNPGKLGIAEPPPTLQTYLPPELSGMQKLLPGAKEKYAQSIARARERYEFDLRNHASREAWRQAELSKMWTQYQRYVNDIRGKAAAQNAEIDRLRQDFLAGLPEAVVNYFTIVIEGSIYPGDFPQQAKIAYVPESKQLVVEYDLPTFEVIPEINSYKYHKTKDEIGETIRPINSRKILYGSMVAQITLRTLYELFGADQVGHLETIVFNGYVDSIDRSTGRPTRTCLVTVRTTRDRILELDLSKVDPIACLKTLNASVSKSPAELLPVRPVLEFNMVDPRFIQETDVLSSLDQRSNLMDLTPSEFESLITNLFQKMGLETRLTQASRDGGVDCVAFDPRPIFGGKVVIQAKRYKNTVGVSAVRDLFGTVQNEGASKGILITTSGFGKASFDFAAGKPLELLSGSNLLALLTDFAGIEAKIELTESWKDPEPDRDF